MFSQADTELKILGGELLKRVEDFKFLGSWIADSKVVESVLLYAAESLMLKNAMYRRLDGTYTRMLGAVVVFTWWEPKQVARERGRPAMTYVDQLRRDAGLPTEELKNIMTERKL